MSTDRIYKSFGHDQHPWMTEARCLDTDADMFPGRKSRESAPAKAVCRGCRVRTACLAYAIDENLPHGVFGGLTEQERARVRRAAR